MKYGTRLTKFRSQLNGFEDFDKLLKNLGPRVGDKVVQSALASSIRIAQREIKKAAPRGSVRSTASKVYGSLVKNIKVIRRLKRDLKKGEKAARVSTGDAFWALFYEFGTRYQAARPFFALAFEKASSAVLEDFKKKLKTGIEKQAIKLRGKMK